MWDSRTLKRDMFNYDNSIVRTATQVPATFDNARAPSKFLITARNRSGGLPFPLKQHGVEHGGTSEGSAFAQKRDAQEGTSSHTPHGQPEGARSAGKTITPESVIKTLVAARYQGKRRAGPETRRLQTYQRKEDRSIAQALGGTQFAPQDRRLSFGALDADFLYQPRRQDVAENPAGSAATGEDGIEAAVSSRSVGQTNPPVIPAKAGQ